LFNIYIQSTLLQPDGSILITYNIWEFYFEAARISADLPKVKYSIFMDCLVSIIRKPDGLVALVSRVLRHIDPANDVPATLGIDSGSGLYEIIESPLELLTSSLFIKKDELTASWNYLSCVDELNTETLFHILVVVINTIWEPLESDFVLPNLPSKNITKQVVKPTAANPRSYQGTKYKPPKPKVIFQLIKSSKLAIIWISLTGDSTIFGKNVDS
jgi:hypothetical protein